MCQTIATVGGLTEESIDPRARDTMLASFRDWAREQ
jgi:hypothetical protein